MTDLEPDPSTPRQPDHDSWATIEVPPSSWVAFWPHHEAPQHAEVVTALSAWLGDGTEIGQAENTEEPEEILWNAAFQVPSIEGPVVIWAERATPFPTKGDRSADEALTRCEWVVRLQAQLGSSDTAADHFVLTSLLAGVMPDAPALLDVSSGMILERRALEEWFLAPEARPTERFLWSVHGVVASVIESGAPQERGLLFTTGLARCGRPELEILDLPAAHMDAGRALLDSVAALLLEAPLPAPGTPLEIGPGLSISFQPWRTVAEFVEAAVPGSAESRDALATFGAGPLDGIRAALCDPQPIGNFRPVWSWPREAISRLESGKASLYSTRRSAEAQSARAQRTWPDFALAWASLTRSEIEALRGLAATAFLILARVDEHEQAWFRVEALEAGSIRAALFSPAMNRPERIGIGNITIAPEAVRDWRVSLGSFDYGPEDPSALLAEVDRLRGIS